MPSISDQQKFFEKLNEQLRFNRYRERFLTEIADHIEDGVHERNLQGINEERAYKEVLTQLGTAKQLSSLYNFVILHMKTPLIIIRNILFVIGLFAVTLVTALFVFLYGHTFYSTKYSDGYSFVKFASLKEGMSKEQVRDIMGDPLTIDTYESGDEWWNYSVMIDHHNGGENWRMRKVKFIGNTTAEIISEIWWD